MLEQLAEVKKFYEDSYEKYGFTAQRRYPNEELCRFMGRNFFSIAFEQRSKVKVLETGCGSGANLWMLARENFDAYGVDISSEGILLADKMLQNYGVKGNLSVQNMYEMNFDADYFDAVVDIFSSYCLNRKQGTKYLELVYKILKKSGLFFSYFPCKNSDAFTNNGSVEFIDNDTLSGIKRKGSPFYGNDYNFRFLHVNEYEQMLTDAGFTVQYSEILTRTYNARSESFSFLVIEAKK